MRRLGTRWQPILHAETAEAARDAVARAQAALSDEHRAGAERQMGMLYDLLVPAIDAWAAQRTLDATSVTPGLLGLWHELLDIDSERESVEELLIWHAGHIDAPALPPAATVPVLPSPSLPTAEAGATDFEQGRAAQRAWFLAALAAAESPRSDWWRRFTRRAMGPLGDCAHITIQRGALIVAEREPVAEPAEAGFIPPLDAGVVRELAVSQGRTAAWRDATTPLGSLFAGDRVTLRWPLSLPGRVLVMHAVGDGEGADLSMLLPADASSEGAPRRAQELVEVVGEVAAVTANGDGSEHSLILIWGPEMLPAGWGYEVLNRRCVPVGARVWRYSYSVATAPSAQVAPSALASSSGA